MITENEQAKKEVPESTGDEMAQLKRDQETLKGELKSRQAAITSLEQAIAEKDAELVTVKKALDVAGGNLNELGRALALAVASYKELVVQANPGVLAELISGETVEQVNESLKNARALVSRVKQEVEAEATRTRIPAGAPQRVKLDLSTLSPREKIQYAIGGSTS